MAESRFSTILVIDDDEQICRMLAKMVRGMGHNAICNKTLHEGLASASAIPCDVVLLDVNLPDGNGLEALSSIRQAPSHPDIIIITGFGDKSGAEIAIRNGAWDYIQKGDSYQKIILTLKRVLQYREQCAKETYATMALNLNGVVGNSEAIKKCFDAIANASSSPANILISGETGTGKEVFARVIHENSPRGKGNMVVVDCAALPETLVESLLFGHEKGVFTGAEKTRQGLIAQADGGTLFLDEIGELSVSIQKVFLRVLQERCFRPVGARCEIKSDFRLIAATNQDLDDMVARGAFRRDLLYRIRTMQIILPPLRDRRDDIKPMVLHYMDKICSRLGIGTKGISADFIEPMHHHAWPGNVRELINTLETVISNNLLEPTLYARHLPEHIRVNAITSGLTPAPAKPPQTFRRCEETPCPELPSLKEYRKRAVARAEREYLQMLLEKTEGQMKTAQDIAGLSRSRFYELLKSHDITIAEQGI